MVVGLASLLGCEGYATVDGYPASYVSAPVGIETYPRYPYQNGYVYDVDGRYYYHHPHDGRWVRFHEAPPQVAHERYERYYRGHAEHQQH